MVNLMKTRREKWDEYVQAHARTFAKEHEDASLAIFSSYAVVSSILDDPSLYGLESVPGEDLVAEDDKSEERPNWQKQVENTDEDDTEWSDDDEDNAPSKEPEPEPVYNTKIWLDSLHLTGRVHEIIARAMVDALDEA